MTTMLRVGSLLAAMGNIVSRGLICELPEWEQRIYPIFRIELK